MTESDELDAFLQNPALDLFLQSNADFYKRKWQLMSTRAQSVEKMAATSSWNWAAFFLGFSWLLYRKMYLYAIVAMGILIAPDIVGAVIGQDFDIIGRGLGLAVGIALGQFGNAWYFKRSFEQIKEAERSSGDPAEVRERLRARGGASWISAIFGTVALAVVAVALNIGIDIILDRP